MRIISIGEDKGGKVEGWGGEVEQSKNLPFCFLINKFHF